jgi:hypothetical protein
MNFHRSHPANSENALSLRSTPSSSRCRPASAMPPSLRESCATQPPRWLRSTRQWSPPAQPACPCDALVPPRPRVNIDTRRRARSPRSRAQRVLLRAPRKRHHTPSDPPPPPRSSPTCPRKRRHGWRSHPRPAAVGRRAANSASLSRPHPAPTTAATTSICDRHRLLCVPSTSSKRSFRVERRPTLPLSPHPLDDTRSV